MNRAPIFTFSFIAALLIGLSMSAPAPSAPKSRVISPTNDDGADPEATEVVEDSVDRTDKVSSEPASQRAPKATPRPIPEPGLNGGAGKRIYHLRIDTDLQMGDMIDRGWHFKLHRALESAEAEGADGFILDLNTNGGALDAAFMMQDRLLDATIPTYVYINSRAISAGAMIAMAADEIVIEEGGLIGDALPVIQDPESPTGMQAAEPKIISVVAAEMRSAAEANGHPVDVAVAMVDPQKPLKGFSEKGELLTLTASESVEAGLTDMLVSDFEEMLRILDLEGAEIVVPKLTPLEWIASQLSRQIVISILGSIAFVGLLLELKTPGVGLPGGVALVCFALIFFGSHVANLSGLIEPLLLLVGIVLLVLEIFVIPGFGIPGIAGAVCILLSVGLSTTELPESASGLVTVWLKPTIFTILGSLLGTVVLFPVLLKALPYIPYVNQAILDPRVDDVMGFGTSSPDAPIALARGAVGIAETDLRPSGSATIEGERYDVVSDGRYVERGQSVVVKEVLGNRIVVSPRT